MPKSKVILLVGGASIAHFAGVIPHEEMISSCCNTIIQQGSHRLWMVTRTKRWGKLVNSSRLFMASHLSGHGFRSRLGGASLALTSFPTLLTTSSGAGKSALNPPCSLQQLNHEYIKVLMAQRRHRSSGAPAATFDAELFRGCVRFNGVLEREGVLRHDPDQPGAELAGMSTGLVRDNPAALAKYIWTQFNNSPRHAQIQADPSLTRVGVSSTAKYWVVRFQTQWRERMAFDDAESRTYRSFFLPLTVPIPSFDNGKALFGFHQRGVAPHQPASN